MDQKRPKELAAQKQCGLYELMARGRWLRTDVLGTPAWTEEFRTDPAHIAGHIKRHPGVRHIHTDKCK